MYMYCDVVTAKSKHKWNEGNDKEENTKAVRGSLYHPVSGFLLI